MLCVLVSVLLFGGGCVEGAVAGRLEWGSDVPMLAVCVVWVGGWWSGGICFLCIGSMSGA